MLFGIAYSSCFDFSFLFVNRSKTCPFARIFSFGTSKKSEEAKSSKCGDWGMITVLFLVKNSHKSINVWDDALSWCNIQQFLTLKCCSLLTPFKFKKIVSQTFIFDQTCHEFFGLGSSVMLHNCYVTNHDLFEQIWMIVGIEVPKRCPCDVVFAKILAI